LPAEIKDAEDLLCEAAAHIRGLIGNDSVAIETKLLKSSVIAAAIILEAHAMPGVLIALTI
jgi:hypothetical protein